MDELKEKAEEMPSMSLRTICEMIGQFEAKHSRPPGPLDFGNEGLPTLPEIRRRLSLSSESSSYDFVMRAMGYTEKELEKIKLASFVEPKRASRPRGEYKPRKPRVVVASEPESTPKPVLAPEPQPKPPPKPQPTARPVTESKPVEMPEVPGAVQPLRPKKGWGTPIKKPDP